MTDQVTTPPDHKLDGIAGWLVIPFVGLMIGIFDHSGSLFDHELTKASVEIFVGNRVLAVGSLVVFTLMCRKHSIFPIMIIVYAVTDTAFHTLEYIATITDWLGIDPKIAREGDVSRGSRLTRSGWCHGPQSK